MKTPPLNTDFSFSKRAHCATVPLTAWKFLKAFLQPITRSERATGVVVSTRTNACPDWLSRVAWSLLAKSFDFINEDLNRLLGSGNLLGMARISDNVHLMFHFLSEIAKKQWMHEGLLH
jgi:hypothetical protein